MKGKNLVYIAKSLDGYIAGKNGELGWLQSIPNPENEDMGYLKFMDRVDALVMGRNTFETVCSFQGEWPYDKPVFVISSTLNSIPKELREKAQLVNGTIPEILDTIHKEGFTNLYIDGGVTIQNFLKEDLIDEMIITTIPILLGGGVPLFEELPVQLMFQHVRSEVFLDQVVQDSYIRKKI